MDVTIHSHRFNILQWNALQSHHIIPTATEFKQQNKRKRWRRGRTFNSTTSFWIKLQSVDWILQLYCCCDTIVIGIMYSIGWDAGTKAINFYKQMLQATNMYLWNRRRKKIVKIIFFSLSFPGSLSCSCATALSSYLKKKMFLICFRFIFMSSFSHTFTNFYIFILSTHSVTMIV